MTNLASRRWLLGLLLASSVAAMESPAQADMVVVCNRGATELGVAALGFVASIAAGSEGTLEAWYTLEPTQCRSVFLNQKPLSISTVNIGFVERGSDGEFHPARFYFDAYRRGSPYRVESFCVPVTSAKTSAPIEELLERVKPTCASSDWELETSATAELMNGDITLNIGDKRSEVSERPGGSVAAESPRRDSADATPLLDESRPSLGGGYPGTTLGPALKFAFPETIGRYLSQTRQRNVFNNFQRQPWEEALTTEAWERTGSFPVLLRCRYGNATQPVYYFWYRFAYDSVQPEKLKSIHSAHPYLLIGAPRSTCPMSAGEARASIERNLSGVVVYTDMQ